MLVDSRAAGGLEPRPTGLYPFGTYSNRLFPTKAVRGWLHAESAARVQIVAEYFAAAGGYEPAQARRCPTPAGGDPLFGVWARVR